MRPATVQNINLFQCVRCENVMLNTTSLNTLLGIQTSEPPASSAPKVPIDVESASAPPKKISTAKAGLLSIASHTILPPDIPTLPKPPSSSPEPSSSPSPDSRHKTQDTIDLPTPKQADNKTEPSPQSIHSMPPLPQPIQNSHSDSFLGLSSAKATTSNEPSLGLPGIALHHPVQDEPANEFGSDDETEELERGFFGDFPTEETELWTEEDEKALENYNSGRRTPLIWIALVGLVVVGGLVLAPLSYLFIRSQGDTSSDSTETTESQEPPPVEQPPETPPTEEEPPSETSETTPDAKEDDNSEPTTKPAAKEIPPKAIPPAKEPVKEVKPPKTKMPAKDKPKSRKQFIQEGWNYVENNPSRAAKSFRQALDISAGDVEANYGYGYAMLKQNDPVEAKGYLCFASGSGDVEIQREVLALLDRNNIQCQ